MVHILPFFPVAHGMLRVDDRRVVSGIVYVIRNGLQWKDAPKGYGARCSIIVSSAGAGLACSIASSRRANLLRDAPKAGFDMTNLKSGRAKVQTRFS